MVVEEEEEEEEEMVIAVRRRVVVLEVCGMTRPQFPICSHFAISSMTTQWRNSRWTKRDGEVSPLN